MGGASTMISMKMSTMLRTLAAVMVLTASQASAATGDWPQFGFTAEGRRDNTQETILTRKTVPHLVQKWSANIALAQPSVAVVANGIVYVAGANGGLYALDAATGAQLWKSGGSSAPAVADGVVYVGSRDGNVYALDAETGAVRWKAPTGIVESPISVAGPFVYAVATDGHVAAIDTVAGVVKWTTPPFGSGYRLSAPAVADGMIFVASTQRLSAFDARTGASLWVQNVGNTYFMSQPASYKGTIIVSDGFTLYAFDAKTGQTRWTSGEGDARDSSIALAGGHVYLHDVIGWLQNYDAATGQLVSSTATGLHPLYVTSAIANGVLYMAGNYNSGQQTTAYDTRTGKQLWQDTSTGTAVPIVSNGMLYVGSASQFTAYGLP